MQKLKMCCSWLVIILLTSTIAAAQKLPKIQSGGLRAPANIKIDGRATEWGYKYAAYNPAADIFYTIANDDDNLYLLIHITNPKMVQKTMMGGIVFTINHSTDKKDDKHIDITFPVMVRADYQKILRIALKDLNGGTYIESHPIKDTALKARHLDTLMRTANEQITGNIKMIGVKGIPGLQDTVLSIYNLMGLALNARFDHKLALTYELAVPLKCLNVTVDKPAPFAYKVTLRGGDRRYIYEGSLMRIENGVVIRTSSPINQDIIAEADFSGVYTLVKK